MRHSTKFTKPVFRPRILAFLDAKGVQNALPQCIHIPYRRKIIINTLLNRAAFDGG
jgi:hypothetical protein